MEKSDGRGPSTSVIVAVIGVLGVLGAALIGNWDKLSARRDAEPQLQRGSPTTDQPSTNAPANPTNKPATEPPAPDPPVHDSVTIKAMSPSADTVLSGRGGSSVTL